MNTASHDFVTVDMRGLKAALVARAHARRVSVSVLVRRAVALDLGLDEDFAAAAPDRRLDEVAAATVVKLSIRMTHEEAKSLAAGAQAAGMSRGAYLAGLVAGVPALANGNRLDHIAALRTSSAELATLSRNVHRLTALLHQANAPAARPYRDMLDSLAQDVRKHLLVAGRVLANLQPVMRSGGRKHQGEDHVPRPQHRRRPGHLG